MNRARRRGVLLLIIGALGLAVIVGVPRVIGSLLKQGLRAAPGDGGASSEVDRVTFAWPARLRVEGLRLRLAAGAEPAFAVQSLDVRLAPMQWLLGEEFVHITVAGPRVVLSRRPDGTYDLIDRLRSEDSGEPAVPNAGNEPEEATAADSDLPPSGPRTPETDDVGDDAGPGERPWMDASPWTRANDPFTFVHGTLNVSNGELLIVDPAAGERTELHDVALAARVHTDEVITFDVAARQRGREGREGAIKVSGHVAFAAGVRFWSDPAEILRRVELDAQMRLAPCTVGDVDIGGEIQAAVHGTHATLAAQGVLNRGTASVRAEAQIVPHGNALAGDLHLDLRHVALCPAFAPVLAQLNPIFDVGNGTLAGRLDTAWTGSWSASPANRQLSQVRGRIRVKELAVSGAPLTTSLLGVLGESGDELNGDLRAWDVRSEDGRVSYDRMALAGRDRKLTFAGTIAEDGVVRLTCHVSRRRPAAPGGDGAPLRIPIVGWLDEPRIRRPERP